MWAAGASVKCNKSGNDERSLDGLCSSGPSRPRAWATAFLGGKMPWGLAVDGWRNEDLAEYAALARTWMEDDDDVYEDVD